MITGKRKKKRCLSRKGGTQDYTFKWISGYKKDEHVTKNYAPVTLTFLCLSLYTCSLILPGIGGKQSDGRRRERRCERLPVYSSLHGSLFSL